MIASKLPLQTFNISLKYLFVAVVFLKLRSDLYTNIGESLLEIGIDDIIQMYGRSEINQGKLGRYIELVKNVARENNLGLTLHISPDQRKNLMFHYLECFLSLTRDKISKSPNAPNFSEDKVRKVFAKIFKFFEGMAECLIFRRIRHVSCAVFFLSLRLIDIHITVQELLDWIQLDPIFNKMMYYSVSRLNREIVDDFFQRFQTLLAFYQHNTKLVVKQLRGNCLFLSQSLGQIEVQSMKKRNNVKCHLFLNVIKFMLKSKVRNFIQKS